MTTLILTFIGGVAVGAGATIGLIWWLIRNYIADN